ncbi:MAG: AbrB/MazE/SpoVT family DNA-binding domain-containing protein [Cyanobacteria bacterium J06635_15]
MQTQLHQGEQSLTVKIPKTLATEAGLSNGMTVELCIVNGNLTLVPATPKYSLDELLAGITPDNLHNEIDTGEAVGQEVE